MMKSSISSIILWGRGLPNGRACFLPVRFNFEIMSYAVLSLDTERDGKLNEVTSFLICSNQAIAINLTNSWHLKKWFWFSQTKWNRNSWKTTLIAPKNCFYSDLKSWKFLFSCVKFAFIEHLSWWHVITTWERFRMRRMIPVFLQSALLIVQLAKFDLTSAFALSVFDQWCARTEPHHTIVA